MNRAASGGLLPAAKLPANAFSASSNDRPLLAGGFVRNEWRDKSAALRRYLLLKRRVCTARRFRNRYSILGLSHCECLYYGTSKDLLLATHARNRDRQMLTESFRRLG